MSYPNVNEAMENARDSYAAIARDALKFMRTQPVAPPADAPWGANNAGEAYSDTCTRCAQHGWVVSIDTSH